MKTKKKAQAIPSIDAVQQFSLGEWVCTPMQTTNEMCFVLKHRTATE